MTPRDRLRIAVQKSGRLSESSQDLLAKCGLKFRTSRDKLFCYGESMPIDLLLVRDDDIPAMIAQGVCELGFVGQNVAREQATEARAKQADPGFVELRELGFGQCRLSIAVPQEQEFSSPKMLEGKRIATSYPALLQKYLAEHGVSAKTVVLSGSVEIAPKLGTADLICDLVSSGATLVANQLKEVAIILESQAVLIGSGLTYADERSELTELLLRRIDGVIRVRESKLVMLQVARAQLPAVLKLLPKADRPTVLGLDGANALGLAQEVAVQAVCHDSISWRHLEELKAAGAHNLLVLPVEKMLA
jgi:ATP phosphoribosyltransferase